MKIMHATPYWSTILLITIFLIGCNKKNAVSKTIISVTAYKRAKLDSSGTFTQLKIIKIYPAQVDCNTSLHYANLYICRELFNGDTIYVFEECEKVPKFALDTNADHIPVVDKNDVQFLSPKKVMIFVPANFTMPSNAKYLFAKLSDISES